MKNLSKILFLCGIIVFTAFSCEEEKNEPIVDDDPILSTEGYIVAYDPCSINSQRRIGYVIISKDLKDTLVTYNISDSTYKMPASIINENSDTLYKIPFSSFQNYVNTAYFPDNEEYSYYVKVTYKKSNENELVYFHCSHDISQGDFYRNWARNQVIVKTITK